MLPSALFDTCPLLLKKKPVLFGLPYILLSFIKGNSIPPKRVVLHARFKAVAGYYGRRDGLQVVGIPAKAQERGPPGLVETTAELRSSGA